jgi:hypothetical protein
LDSTNSGAPLSWEWEAIVGSAQESSELLCFTEQGSGPPLLLVHGLMVSGEMFEPVVKHFAARHRVIVPDLRGHGRSRGLPPPYTAAIPADATALCFLAPMPSTWRPPARKSKATLYRFSFVSSG